MRRVTPGFLKQQAAFTLVEIVVVLVIVGFLAAAVLGGRELLQSAELQRVISEMEKYEIAVKSFRDHYGELPGDFSRAADLWAAASSGGGNGEIGDGAEEVGAWEHMALAGIIPGTYSGVFDANGWLVGTNIPDAAIDPGAWRLSNPLDGGMEGLWLTAEEGAAAPAYAALTPNQALLIDTRMDDGISNEGVVRSFEQGTVAGADDCTDGVTQLYNVEAEERFCLIHYRFEGLDEF